MQYRTMKLRELDAMLRIFGGIEGYYRFKSKQGYPRKVIADNLHMTVFALGRWITKWNRAKKEREGT